MSVDEKRIREFAYQIWESEGRPEGQEARHWEMACSLANAEAGTVSDAPQKPKRARSSAKTEAAAAAQPAEEVEKPAKKARTTKSKAESAAPAKAEKTPRPAKATKKPKA
jgi:hypothetical protein